MREALRLLLAYDAAEPQTAHESCQMYSEVITKAWAAYKRALTLSDTAA
jgi:hypothetical protein